MPSHRISGVTWFGLVFGARRASLLRPSHASSRRSGTGSPASVTTFLQSLPDRVRRTGTLTWMRNDPREQNVIELTCYALRGVRERGDESVSPR